MEKNPLPERVITWMDVARGLGEVALQTFHRFFDHMRYETPSEHFRGAAAQLDQELYNQPQTTKLPIIERPDAGQLSQSINRWDSLGDYYRGE